MSLARASCVSPHDYINHKKGSEISAGLGNVDSGKDKGEEASSSSSSKGNQGKKVGAEDEVHEAAPMTVIPLKSTRPDPAVLQDRSRGRLAIFWTPSRER